LLAADTYTQTKGDMLLPYFRDRICARSVLDLGSANGYFSLLAALAGARAVLGIERNTNLLKQAIKVSRYMGLAQVQFENRSIYDLDSTYRKDVLLALAIIHWFMHTQRPRFSTFENILDYLDGLVGECLFVEYVAPDDPTFIQDPELAGNRSLDSSKFSRDELVRCLKERFGFVKHLGDPRPTRSLYLASRSSSGFGLS
jgi:SAM-dependent methyltransferase